MLMQCFQTLKLYGKEPESLEAANSMFQMVLAEYTIEKIEEAFIFYLKTHNEMPAPADIANIIERGNKPAFDRAVYVAISKKYACDRSSEEWKYMKEYEHFELTGEYEEKTGKNPLNERIGAGTL